MAGGGANMKYINMQRRSKIHKPKLYRAWEAGDGSIYFLRLNVVLKIKLHNFDVDCQYTGLALLLEGIMNCHQLMVMFLSCFRDDISLELILSTDAKSNWAGMWWLLAASVNKMKTQLHYTSWKRLMATFKTHTIITSNYKVTGIQN